MKKLLYTLLAVSLIFSACEEEDAAPINTNNTSGTISDVVGTWEFKGDYDNTGNLYPFYSIDVENCQLQGTITLEADGDAIWTMHYLEDEISGPCLSESQVFSYNYINGTTLQFIFPSACGNATVTLPTSTQFHVPSCNADNGSYDGGYLLYEKQ